MNKAKKRLFVSIVLISVVAVIIVCIWKVVYSVAFSDLPNPYTELGEGYVYVDHDICKLDSVNNLTLVIPDIVTNYMYDDSVIIVRQNPSFVRAAYYWTDERKYAKDSVLKIKRTCYEIGDCFWIIQKQKDIIIGPLSKSEYERYCSELNINLKFDPKYEHD